MGKVKRISLDLIIAVGYVIFLFVSFDTVSAQDKTEKLEDYSKYGYTLKYKDPDVYTTEPGEKKSPYHQKEPALPPALEGRTKPPQWSKPEKLQEVKPEELYMPPENLLLNTLPPPVLEEEEEEEKVSTREGEITLEALGEKIELIIEEVTGKETEVRLTKENSSLISPIVPVEEEEEENEEETPPTSAWEMFFKEEKLILKPLGKPSQEELERIAAYLIEILGRGGEITKIGPEGIEIDMK
ncbi:MAG: hypothetical protein AB7E08_01645 [Candidatus Omnitrophota bacterium]